MAYWYLAAFVASLVFLFPDEMGYTGKYVELQLRRLWLFLRIWPLYQRDRMTVWFILYRRRYNQHSRKQK